MPNYQPDLTGEVVENYIDTYQRMIWKGNQKLVFDTPVFHNDKLEIIAIGSTPTPLVAGTDWVVNVDDVHDDAIAFCKSIDTEFYGTLLKSVTIVRPYIDDYMIQCKFNQLFADDIKYTRLHTAADTLEVTPTLVSNIVEQVDYLQQMVLNASEAYSVQSGFARTLEIDMDGSKPENLVDGELHDINTMNGVSFINPVYGAFYDDSLELTNALSGEVLSSDDYRVLEIDLAKTHNSSVSAGVYRSIEILSEYVGQISIRYQAYGGVTDIVSIESLKDKLVVLESFLSDNSFITPGTLHAEPSIIQIYNKIASMEGNMRLLLQNGLPSYGDVSTNSSVLKKLTSADAMKHWWNLATLYRVEGSNDNVTADVFKFRIKTLYTKMMFECSVVVNVDPTYTGQRIQVTCENDGLPSELLSTISPELRLLEVDNNGVYAGVVLQLGMKLGAGILQETVAVEDMSGKESCWKLVPFVATSINPEDTAVLMPDGATIYTDGASGNTATRASIPFVTPLSITLPSLNKAMTITGYGAADIPNDEFDLVVQEVDEVDWNIIKGLLCRFTVNISSTPIDVDVKLSITSKIVSEQYIMFRTEAFIDGMEYQFTGILVMDAGNGYTLRIIVRALSSAPISSTLNLINASVVLS